MDKKYIEKAKELIAFIEKSPSPFHFVNEACCTLAAAGFIKLDEKKKFSLERGKGYYVTRNSSSLIAFRVPEEFEGINIVSAHTDSPVFRIKGKPDVKTPNMPMRLNVETYGGLLLYPWFDRPLSIAGRAFVKTESGIEEKLVALDTTVLIPNLAIHQNREANAGWKISVQKEMMPIFADSDYEGELLDSVAENLSIDKSLILDMDLYLYNKVKGEIWGKDSAFFSTSKIDDLECAYSALVALIDSERGSAMPMIALFDNEETGSGTKQGALSDLLPNTISRIALSLGMNEEEKMMMISSSRMVSADNGHAAHPAYTEKCDITNRVMMNKGIVVKYSANGKYTTDGEAGAFIKSLMDKHNIPHQDFYNNSDVIGGSTLGNLSSQKVSIRTCDVGLAQLAMHSPYETAGVKDVAICQDFFKVFLSN